MTSGTILLEVDAGPVIGMGHLGRCKVLARALAREGFKPVFRIHGANTEELAAPFDAFTEGMEARAVIIDRYTATAGEIADLRRRYGLAVVFDDHATRPVAADLLLNGNYYATALDYARFTVRKLLLGPEHALVTPDFVEAAAIPMKAGAMLLTFGLSQISGLLPAIGSGLAEAFPDSKIRMIVPEAYRSRIPMPANVRIIAPAPLAGLVGEAELIVCGLGVSWLELVATGRRVVGVRLVDNQDMMFDAVSAAGFPVAARPETDAIIAAIAAARAIPAARWEPLRRQLDGLGPARVVRAISSALAE